MKMRAIKYCAMMMILLVCTLPIAIAQSTVTITYVAGQDGTQNYLRTTDALEVEASVVLDANFSNFTAENLHITAFGIEEAFQSCQGDAAQSCTYTGEVAEHLAAPQTVFVKLLDETDTVVASAEQTIYIDENAPTINDATYPSTFKEDINITIDAQDSACPTCGDVCSGITNVNLLFDGTSKQTIEVEPNSDPTIDPCIYQEIIQTTTAALEAEQGVQEFCIEITDAVNNTAESCSIVTVDSFGPNILLSSFVLKDAQGFAIEHIGDAPLDATVEVNVTEDGTGIDTVYANLSSLNYAVPQTYENVPGECREVGVGNHVCSWSVFIQLVDEAGVKQYDTSVNVDMVATDLAGNSVEATKTIPLVEDSNAPIVLDIYTQTNDYINAKNNTFVMEIQEGDSGFDDLDVFLDLRQLQLGQRQADRCEPAGSLWICYWEQVAIPSNVVHGKGVQVMPGEIKDDAGNDHDLATSITEETFIYDEREPEFINISIGALGREADVITQGDVVYVRAFLEEDVSGLDGANVFADFSEFERSNGLEPAQYCSEVSSDTWECYWEYIGALDAGDRVEMEIIAFDNAGNKKQSDDDGITGDVRVVGLLEGAADFWETNADVEPLPQLNPNFLYFTSTGTMVRLDTTLIPSAGRFPYVHSYEIQGCQILYNDPLQPTAGWLDAAVVGQYYYDQNDKSQKYALVNIPAVLFGQENATVSEGSSIEVVCSAGISQAASMYSDIYATPEMVNITTSVPLMAGLFTEPSLTSVDKIQKQEKLINTLEKITNFLGKWSEWGTKICSPINGVRVVANNMVTILKAIDTLTVGGATQAVAGAVEVTNFLNGVWYGTRDPNKYKGELDQQQIGDTNTFENVYSTDPNKILQNKYKFPSLGYVCDTVLCESCTQNWNKMLLKRDSPGGYVGGQWVDNLLGHPFNFPFSPRENIIIATVCNPPCIPGIYSQLNIYKEILVAYNTCLNIATIKQEDLVQCEEFLAAQICQNVVDAFFWHWFWGLKNYVVSNAVGLVLDKFVEETLVCPGLKDSADPIPSCAAWRSANALFTLGVTTFDTIKTVENMFSFADGLFGKNNATEEQEEIELEIEEDIGDQLGGAPSYG